MTDPRFCITVRQYRGDPRTTVAVPGDPHRGAGALTGGDVLADSDFGMGEEWLPAEDGGQYLWKDESHYARYATAHSSGDRGEGEPPGGVVELTTVDGEQVTLNHADITEIEALSGDPEVRA